MNTFADNQPRPAHSPATLPGERGLPGQEARTTRPHFFRLCGYAVERF